LLGETVGKRSLGRHRHRWEINNFMEQNLFWEAANCAATQEFPKNLWKFHYHVHNSPPLDPILIHTDPVHTAPSWLSSILILCTNLRLDLPSGFFPSGFPTNILHEFLFTPFMLHALKRSASGPGRFTRKERSSGTHWIGD
jgi:hypothetical protein